MKHFFSFIVLLAVAGIFGTACGASAPAPTGGTGGSSSGPGSTTATSAVTTGGACNPAGVACQAFSECCSGTCANQACTACGAAGESCADGCCQGLTCFNNTCGTCADKGGACTLAADCCSNVCTQGQCSQCGSVGNKCGGLAVGCCSGLSCESTLSGFTCCASVGGACSQSSDCCDGSTCGNGACVTCKAAQAACAKNEDCCGGTCTNGKCGACPGTGCADILDGTGTVSDLCGPSIAAYNAMHACLCTGACKAECGTTACLAKAASQVCLDCITDTVGGCGTELDTCMNN